jgi:hypothetical protein
MRNSELNIKAGTYLVTKSKSWKPEDAWENAPDGKLNAKLPGLIGLRTEVAPHIVGVSKLLELHRDEARKMMKHNGVDLLRTIAKNSALDGVYESEILQCLISHLWVDMVGRSRPPLLCCEACA